MKNDIYFRGFCNHCGEVYEAHSGTEDLEGTNFNCKKVFCEGKVTLSVDKISATPKQTFSPFGANKKPSRYC